jgi:hypothetical protein
LRSQRLPGRDGISVTVKEKQTKLGALTAPGQGEVIIGPGASNHLQRSAGHYADVMKKFGGSGA